MKNLALAALLVAASSTGCIISSSDPRTDAVVTARWSFSHFADGTARSCPVGYPDAAIVAQPWDPIENAPALGPQIVDLFNCSDGVATTAPLDGIYQVWVQIQDSAARAYAKSAPIYIDTAAGNRTIDFNILDDAGYFYLSWSLVDAVNTSQRLSCREAGLAGSNGSIDTTVTIAGGGVSFTDRFKCIEGFGVTDPVLAGAYTVSVAATLNNAAIGTAPTMTNRVVRSPNGLTDLGHILIPID